MTNRRFSCALALSLGLICVVANWLVPLVKTSTAAPAPLDKAPFKGKFVLVALAGQHSLVLEQPQVRKLGDHMYLVGKGNIEALPGSWINARMEWVSMNQIESLFEFDSIEEIKKASDEYDKKHPAAAQGKNQGA